MNVQRWPRSGVPLLRAAEPRHPQRTARMRSIPPCKGRGAGGSVLDANSSGLVCPERAGRAGKEETGKQETGKQERREAGDWEEGEEGSRREGSRREGSWRPGKKQTGKQRER